MKDLFLLVLKIHLILGLNLVFTLLLLAIKNLGSKKVLKDLRCDIDYWYVIIFCLTSPYQVILIGFGKVGKEITVILNKVKQITMKSEGGSE